MMVVKREQWIIRTIRKVTEAEIVVRIGESDRSLAESTGGRPLADAVLVRSDTCEHIFRKRMVAKAVRVDAGIAEDPERVCMIRHERSEAGDHLAQMLLHWPATQGARRALDE
jgi:hypothetical protein